MTGRVADYLSQKLGEFINIASSEY